MFRLQVKYSGEWRWGRIEYSSIEAANARVSKLGQIGIKARVRMNEELFN